MSENNGTPTGQQQPSATWGEFNNLAWMVRQAIARLQTATLVRVVACSNNDTVSPVGTVDVVPLVNQIDGQGVATPHVTIFNVPYSRTQGGANAIIIDPKPGDIGIAVFASRDITKVKTTKATGNPGSLRSYNFADALYVGAALNNAPEQFIQFTDETITLLALVEIIMNVPLVSLTGQLVAIGDVIGAEISLQHHTHITGVTGMPTSEPIPP